MVFRGLLNKYAYFTIGREGRVKKMEKKDNLNRRWLALVQVVLDIGRRWPFLLSGLYQSL